MLKLQLDTKKRRHNNGIPGIGEKYVVHADRENTTSLGIDPTTARLKGSSSERTDHPARLSFCVRHADNYISCGMFCSV